MEWILGFQVPTAVIAVCVAGQGRRNSPPWLRPRPVTFSVDTQAPMVEPELTEVGELHSLTDWQVSDASEEAELDEFCSREEPHERTDTPNQTRGHQKSHQNKARRTKWEGHVQRGRQRQTYTQRREGREKQRVS